MSAQLLECVGGEEMRGRGWVRAGADVSAEADVHTDTCTLLTWRTDGLTQHGHLILHTYALYAFTKIHFSAHVTWRHELSL